MSTHQPTAADLARLGYQVVPALERCGEHPDGPCKHPGPGYSKGGHSQPVGLSVASLENRAKHPETYPNRYCLIQGPHAGTFVIETDTIKHTDPDTGEVTTIFVGEESLKHLCRELGVSIPAGPWMRTDSGSIHRKGRYPELPEGQKLGNSASKLAYKVDVRGDGGQILALDGDRRVWEDWDQPIPEWPAALIERMVKAAGNYAETDFSEFDGNESTAYGLAALEDECEQLAATASARLNATFTAGVKLGHLLAGGELALDEIRDSVRTAAIDNGSWDDLGDDGYEVERALDNGLRLGVVDPRSAPTAEIGTKERAAEDITSSWAPVDLGAVLSGAALDPPPTMWHRADGLNLVYPGKTHAFNGESESGKSWAALTVCAERLQAGESVMYIDFEDTPVSIVGRLKALGVPGDVLGRRFAYLRPDEALSPAESTRLLSHVAAVSPAVVILDGVTEAMALHGWDPLGLKDVAAWLNILAKPLVRTGAAVILIDHVTKSRDGRGRWAIGSQHKLAGVDVAYSFDNVRPFGRGREGKTIVHISKDRPGYVRGGSINPKTAAEFHLAERDGTVTTSLRPVVDLERTADDKFRPTIIMEKASRLLADAPNGLSQRDWLAKIGGKKENATQAIDALTDEGHVRRLGEGGQGRPYIYISEKPFTREQWHEDGEAPSLQDIARQGSHVRG